MFLPLMVSNNHGEKLVANDVSRAFSCVIARRTVSVELAAEDRTSDEDSVGKLDFSMYSARDVAHNWGEEYIDKFLKLGFAQGKAPPCTFHQAPRGLRTYVHGDVLVTVGKDRDPKWSKDGLEKHYALKTQSLGPDAQDEKQVDVLNRNLTWTTQGMSYEADWMTANCLIGCPIQLHFRRPIGTGNIMTRPVGM